MSKKILITGGAGFIGSHFAIKVSKLGYKAVVLDNLTYAANLNNLSAIKTSLLFALIKGDITNRKLVEEILRDEKIPLVVFRNTDANARHFRIEDDFAMDRAAHKPGLDAFETRRLSQIFTNGCL